MAAGLELFGLSVLGLGGFLVVIASFVPGFGLGMVFLLPAPIVKTRILADLARRRTTALTAIAIKRPYLPEPPPPVPQSDGWYRRERQLYRTPRWPAMHDRLDWVFSDNATWRDLGWMLLGPLTGGLIALLPTLLVAAGAVLPFLGEPLGLLLIPAGLIMAPAAVHLTARFNRRMLGGPLFRSDVDSYHSEHRVRAWVARSFGPLLRLAVLFLTSILAIPIFAVTVLGIVFGYGLGLIFLVPMVLEDLRWLATWRRSLARWTGGAIAAPYRRQPVLVPNAEGLYQVGKNLYRTQRWALSAQRFTRVADPAVWREVLWRGLDPLVGGVLAGVPALMAVYGIWGLMLPRVTQTLFNVPRYDWYGHVAGNPWPAVPLGLLLVWLAIKLAPPALRWHGRWTRLLLAPTAGAVLAQRVEQLTQIRADATAASATELRRIERALHDGTQSRLVAIGLSLGAIERLLDTDTQAARAQLARTRESAAVALRELRELVRGIHPPVLAERGLGDAVRALALRLPVPTEVSVDLPGRAQAPVESAAYFAVSEVLTNAVKHSGADRIWVDLHQADGMLRASVTDNGKGGAVIGAGSGLAGVERRLGTFDGVLAVSSPAGGPTMVTMEIPCA